MEDSPWRRRQQLFWFGFQSECCKPVLILHPDRDSFSHLLSAAILSLLTAVFNKFGVRFTVPVLIGVFLIQQGGKAKCQILHFLSSEAEMAIYLTRREAAS